MRFLRRLALLGTALSAVTAIVRTWRRRREASKPEALFGDVQLPPVAEAPRFPEPLT
jgi:hypothetical protein